jgi:putative ABC transport system substrate-binding protein
MASHIERRKFLATLGGAAAAWPLAARAQQSGRLIRLGFLGPPLNNPGSIPQYQAFRTQLEELGFREGQNLTVDYRGLDDPRGPFVVAAELVRSRPDLIVAAGPETALQAVVGASGFVPVVMIAVNFDPLARARPGGNITGFVFQQLELARKQVELLTQAFPDRTRLALLFDAQSADQFGAAETAAKALTLQVQALRLENPRTTSTSHFVTPCRAGRRWPSFYQPPPSCHIWPGSLSWRTRTACPPCSSANIGRRRVG